jgi:uncharacterized protein YjaG (DUF416 family)
MNYKGFNKKFQSRINRLEYKKQYELAIAICKKLFPDYKDFHIENNWGDPDILIDAIKSCELYFQSKTGIISLKEMLPKIDSIVPDTEDFGNASCALNAGAAVYETLEFLIDRDHKHILNVGTYLINTIDSKLQEEDDLTEQQIDSHPLMVEARDFLLSF